jgi:hypothetical protein
MNSMVADDFFCCLWFGNCVFPLDKLLKRDDVVTLIAESLGCPVVLSTRHEIGRTREIQATGNAAGAVIAFTILCGSWTCPAKNRQANSAACRLSPAKMIGQYRRLHAATVPMILASVMSPRAASTLPSVPPTHPSAGYAATDGGIRFALWLAHFGFAVRFPCGPVGFVSVVETTLVAPFAVKKRHAAGLRFRAEGVKLRAGFARTFRNDPPRPSRLPRWRRLRAVVNNYEAKRDGQLRRHSPLAAWRPTALRRVTNNYHTEPFRAPPRFGRFANLAV